MKQFYTTAIIFILSSPVIYAQTCKNNIATSTPDSRFTVSGQEVIDQETGLIWQKCSFGQTGNDCSTGVVQSYNWSEALLVAETESLATGETWRLPNIKELLSITEVQCLDPAINQAIFPNTDSSPYWSATPNGPSGAWNVSFHYGYSGNGNQSNSVFVRLVRSGE